MMAGALMSVELWLLNISFLRRSVGVLSVQCSVFRVQLATAARSSVRYSGSFVLKKWQLSFNLYPEYDLNSEL